LHNSSFEHYITNLSPTDNTLWKATKHLKCPQAPKIHSTFITAVYERRWIKPMDINFLTYRMNVSCRLQRRHAACRVKGQRRRLGNRKVVNWEKR
jgi:hypothetical protein